MKQLIFTFITVIFSLWLEVTFSNLNLVLPVFYLQLFYITTVRKWRWSGLTALIACTITDSLLGYTSLPGAVLVIMIASFWRNIGDCSRSELQVVPVGFAMFLSMLALFGSTYLKYGGHIVWLDWSLQFAFAVLVTALLAPTYIKLQDLLAIKLKISTYTHIQREELYSASS